MGKTPIEVRCPMSDDRYDNNAKENVIEICQSIKGRFKINKNYAYGCNRP